MTFRNRALAVALFACLVTRLFFLLLPAVPLETKALDAVPDAREYQVLAHNLARHQSFSRVAPPEFRAEVLRTPGYPLFLAPFHAAFRDPLLPILLAQIVLSLLLVVAVRRLALELTASESVASLSALILALSPNLAFLSTKVVTETLFTLLLVVCFILFERARRWSRTADALGAGACCGLLALIRPIALYLPLLLGLLLIIRWQSRTANGERRSIPAASRPGPRIPLPVFRVPPFPARLVAAILLVACAALVLLPWFARNGRLTGRPILSTAGEHNLFLYNAATAVAAENRVSLAEARDLMRAEAEEDGGALDTLDEPDFWKRLTPIAWKHVLRRPLLAAGVQLAGFASALAGPISLRPLLVHSGANPDVGTHAGQGALADVARGRPGSGLSTLWRTRVSRLGWFGIPVFALAALFQLALMALAVVGLTSTSALRRSPLVSRTYHLSPAHLLLPILYFTLLTGALGEARMRAPVEPLLAILAAAGWYALRDRQRRRA